MGFDEDVMGFVSSNSEEGSRHMEKVKRGNKNYMTPYGRQNLLNELKQLVSVERPDVVETVAWAASNGDRSENADYIYGKKRLKEIDRRIQFLTEEIESATVIDPTTVASDRVLFGATVTVRIEDSENAVYTIVGTHEAEARWGWISWLSPVGQALLQSQKGDVVEVQSPRGDKEMEVLAIEYRPIKPPEDPELTAF